MPCYIASGMCSICAKARQRRKIEMRRNSGGAAQVKTLGTMKEITPSCVVTASRREGAKDETEARPAAVGGKPLDGTRLPSLDKGAVGDKKRPTAPPSKPLTADSVLLAWHENGVKAFPGTTSTRTQAGEKEPGPALAGGKRLNGKRWPSPTKDAKGGKHVLASRSKSSPSNPITAVSVLLYNTSSFIQHAGGLARHENGVEAFPGTASTRTQTTSLNTITPAEFVEEHNAYRCELGLEPLSWDCELAAAAQLYADHQAINNNCAMVHSTNEMRQGFLATAGYGSHAGASDYTGENLAWLGISIYVRVVELGKSRNECGR